MPASNAASISNSCTNSGESRGLALPEQVNGKNGCFIAVALSDPGNQCMGGWVGDPVETALQRRRRCLGIETGSRDVRMAEEPLHVGDFHAEGQQLRRHRVTQQVGINTFGDASCAGDVSDDLADALADVDVCPWAGTFLTTHEQRPGTTGADMQAEELSEFARIGTSRRLPPLPRRMITTGSAKLMSSTGS
jgi:hypothetical protein